MGSLTLSHEPLLYVDGIRIDNDPNDGITIETGSGNWVINVALAKDASASGEAAPEGRLPGCR